MTAYLCTSLIALTMHDKYILDLRPQVKSGCGWDMFPSVRLTTCLPFKDETCRVQYTRDSHIFEWYLLSHALDRVDSLSQLEGPSHGVMISGTC